MRISAITPMKNEGPFILEWVAYHRLIGVSDVLVFRNDCEDGTDMILERLDELGVVRHLPNPSRSVGSAEHHKTAVRYVTISRGFAGLLGSSISMSMRSSPCARAQVG
ncbi:MAG: glycosyltransferase family 2 protein [Pseudomonadota bacterium]